jgi:hypothetical protein
LAKNKAILLVVLKGLYDNCNALFFSLHILHELEDCLGNVFQGEVDENDMDTTLSNLQKRLTVTRVSCFNTEDGYQ